MALTVEAVELEAAGEAPPLRPGPKRLGLEQLVVASGQLAAGLGNLGFTLAAAQILAPADFAHLTVFLGMYLVLSLPATSLSAAAALDPGQRDAMVRRVVVASAAGAVAAAGLSPWLGPLLHLPVPLVLALAAAVPAAGPLALERGRLYGRRRHARVVGSLLAEPAVRLGVGVVLALSWGAVGGATGVVLAAYVALEVARTRRRSEHRRSGRRRSGRRRSGFRPSGHRLAGHVRAVEFGVTTTEHMPAAGWTAAAFALLAIVQNQDLFFANALLPGTGAGQYAALSTLGGAAAFATITIPLVLLPRAARRHRSSVAVAVATAAAIGAAAVAVGIVGSGPVVRDLFGSRYAPIAPLLAPYLAAMGLLGVARVLVAARCAVGAARPATLVVAAVAVGQAAAIALTGHRVHTIAMLTLAATGSLTVVLVGERLVRRRSVSPLALRIGLRPAGLGHVGLGHVGLRQKARSVLHDPTGRTLLVVCLAGLAARLVVWRGIWLDEATSVHQVHMSFAAMIANLRDTDVHPPLYFSVLWLSVRIFGYGSMAIRIPSVAAGLLVIPAVYLAGRDLWNRRTGLVAAALASVAPLLVWYSQEVRMYSMFMLFAVLAIWGQVRVIRWGRPSDWAIYVLASSGLAWTEYFGLFQVAAQQMYFVWLGLRSRLDRRRLAAWGAATGLLLLSLAPLAPFAWHQFMVNQNAGKGFGAPSQTTLAGTQSISVYTVLANLAWAAVGYHSPSIMEALVALWPLGILLSLFVMGRKATTSTKLVLVAAAVPAALLLAAGMEKRFLYDVRYMSGVAVAVVLLAARMVTGASRRTRVQVLGCAALVLVLLTGLLDEQFNGTNPRLYDFSGALSVVNREWRGGDRLVYSPESIQSVLAYYSPKAVTEPVANGAPAVGPGGSIFVVASPNLMDGQQPGQLQRLLRGLTAQDGAPTVTHESNVTLWAFVVPKGGRA